MNVPTDAARLRIYVGHNDAYEDLPLAEALIVKARQMGMAGATALHGVLGYGQPSHARQSEMLLLRDKTAVIEVVDLHAKIETFLAAVEPMIQSGLVTIEDIRVLRYGPTTGQARLC
jgi:uncharacterized protein